MDAKTQEICVYLAAVGAVVSIIANTIKIGEFVVPRFAAISDFLWPELPPFLKTLLSCSEFRKFSESYY